MTVLIPAYNEEAVIATSVAAALAVDYPELEVLVLDDGSTDATEAAALAAAEATRAAGCSATRSTAARPSGSTSASAQARHELVAVTDADTHMHPAGAQAARRAHVAARRSSPRSRGRRTSPTAAACSRAMQVLEAASIIGLIRRTQSLTGRVGVVAGVLGLFRRDRVLAVGGYDPRMATEDIDLTLEAAARAAGTPPTSRARSSACRFPPTLRALWTQRKRWARGQGEVLHVHFGRGDAAGATAACGCSASKRSRRCSGSSPLAAVARHRRARHLLGVGDDVFGFALGVGRRDRRRGHRPADGRAHPRARLRPQHLPGAPRRRALPGRRTGSSPAWPRSARRSVRCCAGRRDRRVVWDIPRQPLADQRDTPRE